MLRQLLSLKHFFSWREMISNVRALKKARSPIRGYVTTICFWALMDIGLLDILLDGASISQKKFAEQHGLNPDILRYIVRYLNRRGYLEIRDDQIALSPQGRVFWKDVKSVYHLFYGYEPLFSSLSRQLKNTASFGKELFRREDEVAHGFSELGRSFLFKIMARLISEEGFKGVVDLGCAEVELSTYLCQRYPDMKCLGIDISPQVIDRARRKIEDLNLGSRIEVLQYDMFQIDQARHDFSSYDVVTAIDLFHGYFLDGEEKLISLFRKLRGVFSQQRFLISEICLPPERAMSKIAYPYVEHELFHDLTRQKSFASGQLESLLEQAGFQIRKRWNFNEIAGRICLLL